MIWKSLAITLLAIAAIALFSRPPERPLQSHGEPLLPRFEFLHALGAAEQNMVADYYWIGAIQQLGIARDQYGYGNVYYYVDLVTDLDPKFYKAYNFAATAVTYNLGHWNWVNTDESTKIILKGLKAFPDDPNLQMILAYNLMYFDHKFREAAEIVERLSKRPDAPPYLAALASRLFAQSGQFDTAISFTEELLANATDEHSRAFYEHRIDEIHLEEILQKVDAASKAYFEREHHLAPNIEALVSSGFLPEVPTDPLGGVLQLDSKGRGESTAEKHRLEVYGAENPAPVE